jgi:DNA invertase Pin-like site-specific DNA recombinase
MRAVIYSRVSTSDKNQNPEVQSAELRRFCEARGWELFEEITDHGFSGSTDKRPGLQRLVGLAKARKIDVVLVVKLDRLARSLRHLVSLLDEFASRGVQFVSIRDQIDLTTASGRLMMHLLGAFAEFERSLIRERTMAGLDHARRCGKKLGRPKTRDDAAILRLRQEGLSYTQIQKQLGVSRPSIHRAIVAATSTKSPPKLGPKSSNITRGQR